MMMMLDHSNSQPKQQSKIVVRRVLPFLVIDPTWDCLGPTKYESLMWSITVYFNNQWVRIIHFGKYPFKFKYKGIYKILVKVKEEYEGFKQFQIDYNAGEGYPVYCELIKKT